MLRREGASFWPRMPGRSVRVDAGRRSGCTLATGWRGQQHSSYSAQSVAQPSAGATNPSSGDQRIEPLPQEWEAWVVGGSRLAHERIQVSIGQMDDESPVVRGGVLASLREPLLVLETTGQQQPHAPTARGEPAGELV